MILNFDKPKKVYSKAEYSRNFRSSAPAAGTYVPNMSDEDRERWKAKKILGKDPRIEIRKTVSGIDPSLRGRLFGNAAISNHHNCRAQILLIVRPDNVIMSGNGRMVFDTKTWKELQQIVEEAKADPDIRLHAVENKLDKR
jgi:hypothetical protein